MSKIYTTLADLIDREIVPALDGVEPIFDVDGFTQALRDADLIVYVTHEGAAQRDGFQLVTDDDNQTPRFWDMVAKFDAEAQAK